MRLKRSQQAKPPYEAITIRAISAYLLRCHASFDSWTIRELSCWRICCITFRSITCVSLSISVVFQPLMTFSLNTPRRYVPATTCRSSRSTDTRFQMWWDAVAASLRLGRRLASRITVIIHCTEKQERRDANSMHMAYHVELQTASHTNLARPSAVLSLVLG